MFRTRRGRALTAGGLLAVIIRPGPAQAAPGKCDIPFADPLCEASKTAAEKAGDLASAPVQYAAGSAVDTMTSWVADTAQWILGRVVNFIEESTTPTLDASWFAERYEFMAGL